MAQQQRSGSKKKQKRKGKGGQAAATVPPATGSGATLLVAPDPEPEMNETSTGNGEPEKSEPKAASQPGKPAKPGKGKGKGKGKSGKSNGKAPKAAKLDDKPEASRPQGKETAGPDDNRHKLGGRIAKRDGYKKNGKMETDYYLQQLDVLQTELVKYQYWVKEKGLRIIVIFEGRDAAGKGGVIKRISDSLNPRGCRVVALGTPTEKERTQWYFQRYTSHLPAAGEIVLFDRSWYNRAGVEHVMGFCTREQYKEFLLSCPEFERMLVRSGITLVKYWFSVSDDEQERRFRDRAQNPSKRWKLSPMDIESRARWVEYSKAKDRMFEHTDIQQAPWFVVNADDKKRARLNCISHLLSRISYQDVIPPPIELPERSMESSYVRPPMELQKFVPERY